MDAEPYPNIKKSFRNKTTMKYLIKTNTRQNKVWHKMIQK